MVSYSEVKNCLHILYQDTTRVMTSGHVTNSNEISFRLERKLDVASR